MLKRMGEVIDRYDMLFVNRTTPIDSDFLNFFASTYKTT